MLMLWLCLCLCLWSGVGASELNSVSVKEGESVTLHTDREMRSDDLILWRFGPENTVIAEISVTNSTVALQDDYDERFRGRLKVDHQTGCLTITDSRPPHAGRYQLQTQRMKKIFILTVRGVSDGGEEPRSLSVMEGESVTLHTDTEIRNSHPVLWSFENYTIAESKETSHSISVCEELLEGMFRDRLKVDDQTGSLTITNTRPEHTGLYHVQTSRTNKLFILNVYAALPAPVIFSHCPSSSSASRRVLLCSVVNVSHVTLSWFRGGSVLSSVSASDLSLTLSLSLELEYQDLQPYSCVLHNPVTKQTTHLDTSLRSRSCSDSGPGCGEAAFRLVVTALVGVAAVAAVVVLLYDIRSRRANQERAVDPTSAA